MDRERLTKERIKHLLLKDFYQGLLSLGLLTPILLLLSYPLAQIVTAMITGSSKFVSNPLFYIPLVLYFLFIFVLYFYFLKSAIFTIRGIITVKKNRFTISSDRLVRSEKACGNPNIKYSAWTYKPTTLYFASHKKFEVPPGQSYPWSKKFSFMNEKDMFHSSDLNDTFLLVSTDEKKIMQVYNTKLFELVN